MVEVPIAQLWEWWGELAIQELKLEREYKPLIAEHEAVHRRRAALETLMAALVAPQDVSQQISSEWEELRKREQLPTIEQRPTEVAFDVLARSGNPMHYRDILAEARKRGALIGGRDPGTTLIAYLGRDKRFSKARELGRGYWGLKEWEK